MSCSQKSGFLIRFFYLFFFSFSLFLFFVFIFLFVFLKRPQNQISLFLFFPLSLSPLSSSPSLFHKKIKEETFVIAFSYILLAEMRVENNPPNLKEATNLVTKAKGMSDFDFDNILSHRIKRVENMVLMRKKE